MALMLGFVGMFAASFLTIMNGSSEDANAGSKAVATRDTPEGEGVMKPSMGFNFSDQEGNELTELMTQLQANPNDAAVLTEIGNFFMRAEEWTRAEAFLRRAIISKPSDTRPLYLMAICLFRQGKPAEAAKNFEDLLQIKNDPSAMFNLALLYKHHLGAPDPALLPEQKQERERMQERARMLLQKVADSPDANAELKNWAKEELTVNP